MVTIRHLQVVELHMKTLERYNKYLYVPNCKNYKGETGKPVYSLQFEGTKSQYIVFNIDMVYRYEVGLSLGHSDWDENYISPDSSDNDLDIQV